MSIKTMPAEEVSPARMPCAETLVEQKTNNAAAQFLKVQESGILNKTMVFIFL
jgi:hypothetical protein